MEMLRDLQGIKGYNIPKLPTAFGSDWRADEHNFKSVVK